MESAEILSKNPLTTKEKESLSTLCLLPRTWINRSISVEYKLRGTQMYEQFSQAAKTIKKMEKKHKHPLLNRLKEMLMDSIKDKQSTYEDLKKAHCFLGQLTDILYGKKQKTDQQKQLVRLSEEHRSKHTVEQIEQKTNQLIEDFKQNNKKRSTLCRKIIRNFESTYENWKPNIFTCYEHDIIPNDNNSLESNHNKVKRAIRKTTGNKSTAQALLVYGEEFISCQSFFDKPAEDFLLALSEVDFELVSKRQKLLREEQKKRGLKIKVVNRTQEVLKKVYDDW